MRITIRPTIFVMFLMVPVLGFSQYTEWKEYGLKGKVKTITSYHYQLVKQKGDSFVPEDHSKWCYKITMCFSEQGNVDSIAYTYNYKNFVPSMPYPSITFKYFYFDEEDGNRKGFIKMQNAQQISSYLDLKWNGPYLYVEEQTEAEYPIGKRITTTWLNKNYRDSAGMSISYNGDSIYSKTGYVTTFNEKGEIESYLETDYTINYTNTVRYKFKKYDSKGNFTLLHTSTQDEFPKQIEIRKYTYYRD